MPWESVALVVALAVALAVALVVVLAVVLAVVGAVVMAVVLSLVACSAVVPPPELMLGIQPGSVCWSEAVESMTTVTRRLALRPCAVALLATGC